MGNPNFKLPLDYVDVAARIVEFREKYPSGSLQQLDLKFIDFAGSSWVVYTAAAYRSPEDPKPGVGTAWECVPGKTPYTRDSELQNAETAAWGRAIVAALAADTKKGIASADEIRNRTAERTTPVEEPNWIERAKGMDYAALQGWYKMAVNAKAPQDVLDQLIQIGKEKAPAGN